MYRATTSFTTKDYDIKYKEILADDFTSQEEINEFLDIGYIEPYDDTLEITENGIYNVNDYKKVDVNVSGGSSNVLVVPDGMKFAYSSTFGDYELDTSNVTTMSYMFYACSQLTTIPLLDTSNVTYMSNMFNNCSQLTTIPLLDTSNVETMSNMFNACSHLTTIPLLDTSNVETMSNMFNACSQLTTIPLLDTSNVTTMSNMFYACSQLTTIPLLDTSNVTTMSYMFYACSQLTTIPLLDTSNVTNMNNMFSNCSNLSNETLNNILEICINAILYKGTKTLKQIGISSTQATTCQSLSNWNDFVSAGWSTGY